MPCSNKVFLRQYNHFITIIIIIMSSILLLSTVQKSKAFLLPKVHVVSKTRFVRTATVRGSQTSSLLAFHTTDSSSFHGKKIMRAAAFATTNQRLNGSENVCSRKSPFLSILLSSTRPFSGGTQIRQTINDDNSETQIDDVYNNEFNLILHGLNNAQIEAVTQPTQSVTRVVAGPGAGKTRVLTCRIAYLLKKEHIDRNWKNRVLAVTFTKKAASEMQHRLNTLLREDEEYQKRFYNEEENSSDGGGGEDPETGDIIEEVAPHDTISSGDTNSRTPPPILTTRVTMGTFHSICSKILRWHGKELTKLPSVIKYSPKNESDVLDGSFAIIDQSEQIRVINQCLTPK